MKRLFDILMASGLFVVGSIPLIAVAAAVKLTSKGPVLYWSDRVGRDNRIFRMPKFRTMRVDTPEVASHLLSDPKAWLTPIGDFLRRTSLDELPQLWNILTGDMSFVGPRPALFNQDDLVAMRTAQGVHELVPGLTGWAQINGRDELPIPVKVSLDVYYLEHRSFLFDMKILFLTFLSVVRRHGTVVPADVQGDNSKDQSAGAFRAAGDAWLEKREFDKAVADYCKALEFDAEIAAVHNNRGVAWAAQGEYERAVADYSEAVRLDPQLVAAFANRGEARTEMGEYEKAVEDFAKVLELDADYPTIYTQLGPSPDESGSAQAQDAKRAIELARHDSETPGFKDAALSDVIAAAFAEAERFDDAVRWQTRAVELAPDGKKDEYRRHLELYQAGKSFSRAQRD